MSPVSVMLRTIHRCGSTARWTASCPRAVHRTVKRHFVERNLPDMKGTVVHTLAAVAGVTRRGTVKLNIGLEGGKPLASSCAFDFSQPLLTRTSAFYT